MAFSKEALVEALNGILSPDQETKQAAERKIRALEIQGTDEFGTCLVDYVLCSQDPVKVRGAASATLKQYVKTHWCSTSEGFQPPEISSESKIKIKQLLPKGLWISSRKVRNDVVDSILVIARSDWPEHWPTLLATLIDDSFEEENVWAAHGVMRVLSTLTEELTEMQLAHAGPIISREMYRIFENKLQYSVRLRARVVAVFAEMVSTVAAYKKRELIQEYLEPSITKFCAEFVQTDLKNDAVLACEIIKAIRKLTITLPKCISNFLPKMLPLIWQTLICSAKVYRKNIVNTDGNIDNEDTDSDEEEATDIDTDSNIDNEDTDSDEEETTVITGENIGNETVDLGDVQQEGTANAGESDNDENTNLNGETPENLGNLISAIFKFINILMSGSDGCKSGLPEYNLLDYHWFYLQDSLPPEVLNHLIIFIEITDEQIEQWTDDPSRFVVEEKLTDESSQLPHGIRGEAQKLLAKIVHRPERAAANALCDVILKQIEAGDEMQANSSLEVNQNWWKLHESSIQVFGLMKDTLSEKQQEGTLSFDVVAFLKNVILVNLNKSGNHPLLLARCLYIGGLYADQMPLELKSQFLEATINALKNHPACARICAAKASNYWLRAALVNGNNHDIDEILKPHLPALFQELFDLGNQFMSAEVLTIVLENFATLASLDQAFTSSVKSKICTLAIASFVNFRSNCLVFGICQKIFKELTLNPACVESLQTYLVPTLVGGLNVNPPKELIDDEAQVDALEVLILLVQHSPRPLSSFLINSAFPATYRLILNSDKYCTSLKGGKVIRTYLSVAAEQVMGYKNTDGRTGPQYILQVATHLFNFQCGNHLAEDACEIVTLLIKKAGNALGENVDKLLSAVFGRMKLSATRVRTRRLLMVWAHFINTDFEAVLKYLSTAKGPNEQCAYAFVISDGFCKEHEFFDRDDRRTITLALSKILSHSVTQRDSRLHQINFHEGDGDTGTPIPLLVEISKLISDELSSDTHGSL